MVESIIWLVVWGLVLCAVAAGLAWIVRTAPFVPDNWKPTIVWVIWALLLLVGLLLLVNFAQGGRARLNVGAMPAIEGVG